MNPQAIQDYIDRHGMTQTAFARLVGVRVSAVNHWLAGRKACAWYTCNAIEEATGGELRAADIRPDIFGAAA